MIVSESAPVAVGDIIAGKLEVERILGRGGMGVVVAARHLHLDERVAVKLLLPEIARDEEFTERFLREARAAIRIKSEHVARVMDVGTFGDGVPYIVMEYLEGDDLEVLIAREGPMPTDTAVDFVLQACEAIAEAHAAGIVHRDLKPSNLFCTRLPDGSPHIKVLDFGISKKVSGLSADLEQGALTKTGGLMGSPAYMSPEQVRSTKRVDARTDIWSLGVILYELLVGRAPFNGENVGGLLAAIIEDHPVAISEHRQDVPRPLSLSVMRCLEKDPSKRPQSIAAFAASISSFGSDTGRLTATRIQRFYSRESAPSIVVAERGEATGEVSHDAPTLAQTAVAVSQPGAIPQPSRRLGWIIGVAAAVVVAVVAFALVGSAWSDRQPNPSIVAPNEVASAIDSAPDVPALAPSASQPETASSAAWIADASAPPAASPLSPTPTRDPKPVKGKLPKSGAEPTPASTNTSKGSLDGLIDERR